MKKTTTKSKATTKRKTTTKRKVTGHVRRHKKKYVGIAAILAAISAGFYARHKFRMYHHERNKRILKEHFGN